MPPWKLKGLRWSIPRPENVSSLPGNRAGGEGDVPPTIVVHETSALELGHRVPFRPVVLIRAIATSVEPVHLKPEPFLFSPQGGERPHRAYLGSQVGDRLTCEAQFPHGVPERIQTRVRGPAALVEQPAHHRFIQAHSTAAPPGTPADRNNVEHPPTASADRGRLSERHTRSLGRLPGSRPRKGGAARRRDPQRSRSTSASSASSSGEVCRSDLARSRASCRSTSRPVISSRMPRSTT